MGITWGTAVGAGHSGGQLRLGYEFSQSPAVVAGDTASVTVTLDIWIWTKYSGYDQYNTFRVSGAFSSSTQVSFTNTSDTAWSTSNQKKVRTLTRTFAPSAIDPIVSSFSASLKGIEAIGVEYTAKVSGSWSTASQPRAPYVPTLTTAWASYTLLADVLRISWGHSAPDGSAQAAADIVYTIDGAETTYTLEASTGYYDIPLTGASAGEVVTAKVRTYGSYVDPSEYSAVLSTILAAEPQVTVTTPADAGTVEELPITVEFTYTADFAMAGWAAELYDEDSVLLGTWSGTTGTSFELTGIVPSNNAGHLLRLTVRSGSGYQTTVDRTFETGYEEPPAPGLEAEFDRDTYVVTIAGEAAEDDPELPATDHLALIKIETFDGVATTITLADPFQDGATYTDRTPRLDQDVVYRLLAVAENGAVSYDEAVVATRSGGFCVINFGESDDQLLLVEWNHQPEHQPTDDSESFLFTSREKPVTYEGEHSIERVSTSAISFEDNAQQQARAFNAWKRSAWFREPGGFRMKGTGRCTYRRGARRGSTELSIEMTESE